MRSPGFIDIHREEWVEPEDPTADEDTDLSVWNLLRLPAHSDRSVGDTNIFICNFIPAVGTRETDMLDPECDEITAFH
jgi:hypothetical protein